MHKGLNWIEKGVRRVGSFVENHECLRLRVTILLDWWGTKVWKKTTEVMTPYGFKFRSGFHPAYKAMRNGQFEIEETALIERLLDKVEVFVDIGANLGYFTLIACKKHRKVIAFEPQPQNLKCLFQNLVSNGWEDRAEIFPVALAERAGLLTLYGASGPSASLIKNWSGYSARYQQTVPTLTLDGVLSGRFIDKSLLVKIDVEGAEYQVLQGALEVMSRSLKPVWIVEVFFDKFHPQGVNPFFRDVFKLFKENGYDAYTASKKPELLNEADIARMVDGEGTHSAVHNYLFVGGTKVSAVMPG